MQFLRSIFEFEEQIDRKIETAIGRTFKKRLIVHSADLPIYRLVDVSTAVAAYCERRPNVERIETQQEESLNQIIHDPRPDWANRTLRKATRVSWPIAPQEDTYLPVDCFWICPAPDLDGVRIIRVKVDDYSQKVRLEIACCDTDSGKSVHDEVLDYARIHSIYRDKTLQLAYDAGKRDEYGDIEKPERFMVMFSPIEPVKDKDIVLSDTHVQTLKRNILDLYTHRNLLEANGVPTRRGVLLHGPPGTGKTYACRYLCHKLDGVTRVFVSGSSLLHVSAVFSFARLMQPTVLFLEDVDLIFATREINLYSTALGDLLDQMDGLRPHENVSVVLTTNAIDRLEAAIKDRPGRISQCIYMGAPEAEQRELFLKHQLAAHQTDNINFDTLVRDSDGATQAFLKEWTHRAIQIACERLDSDDQKAALTNQDFKVAMDEMRQFLDGSDGKIIGFVARG